jgi:nitroreductase
MKLIDNLNWRYAVKRMTGQKVPQQQLDYILEAIRLSASSVGLQPYKIIIVEDDMVRKQILPAANNQPQITEASHLLVFAAYDNITADHIDDYMNLQSSVKKVSLESLAGFRAMLTNNIASRSAEANFNWAARQAYIALGTALVAAAEEKIDATPMEGFNPAVVDEILDLPALGLKSVAILALGYRDEANDYLVNAPKVRKHMKDLVLHFPAI